jgi:hypothetical protein
MELAEILLPPFHVQKNGKGKTKHRGLPGKAIAAFLDCSFSGCFSCK